MDLSNLPPEYAAEIQRLQRQQRMAEILQQQAMQGMNQPTQVLGGYAVKRSPLEGIAQALTGYAGMRAGNDASAGITAVQGKAQTEATDELGQLATLFQTDPKAAIAQALASRYNQKQGGEWQKQYNERINQVGGAMKDTDPGGAVQTILTQTPPQNWQPPAIEPPKVVDMPGVGPTVQTTNRKGEPQVQFPPKGQNITTNVTNKIPGMEGQAVLDSLQSDLKLRRERAQTAKESLDHNRTAREAINKGALSGGGESLKQGLRKAAQAFGVEAPATAPTEQLQMALGNAVLAKARALAPVTGEDVKRLEQILGSINTDPTALGKMLDIYDSLAIRELQTFNEFVDHQAKNLETPYARDLFKGQNIGYSVPKTLPGTPEQQDRVKTELGARGGDPSGIPTIPPVAQPTAPISLDEYLKRLQGGK